MKNYNKIYDKKRKNVSIYFNVKYYSFFQLLKYFVCAYA